MFPGPVRGTDGSVGGLSATTFSAIVLVGKKNLFKVFSDGPVSRRAPARLREFQLQAPVSMGLTHGREPLSRLAL